MITVADLCPYWSWPPTGGGPLRVYNLNKRVAAQVQVLQFSVRPPSAINNMAGLAGSAHEAINWPRIIGSTNTSTRRFSVQGICFTNPACTPIFSCLPCCACCRR